MKQREIRVIDAHAHVIERLAGIGHRGELRPLGNGRARWANGDEVDIFIPEYGATGFSPARLIAEMDACGVEKAVLLQGSFYGYQNEYTLEAQTAHPGRFAGMGAFDPYALCAAELMHRFLDDFGFRGLKFEMSSFGGFMGYHPDFRLDGEVIRPFLDYVCERGKVVSLDIGSFDAPSFQLDALAAIARRYPAMPIVIEHLFCPPLNRAAEMARALEKIEPLGNVCVTLATLPFNTSPEAYPYPTAQAYVRMAVDRLGAMRVLWGSDTPSVVVKETYMRLIDYLYDSNRFTRAEKEAIFHGAAERVYGL